MMNTRTWHITVAGERSSPGGGANLKVIEMAKQKKVSPYGPKGQPITYRQHQAAKRKAMQKKQSWDR